MNDPIYEGVITKCAEYGIDNKFVPKIYEAVSARLVPQLKKLAAQQQMQEKQALNLDDILKLVEKHPQLLTTLAGGAGGAGIGALAGGLPGALAGGVGGGLLGHQYDNIMDLLYPEGVGRPGRGELQDMSHIKIPD